MSSDKYARQPRTLAVLVPVGELDTSNHTAYSPELSPQHVHRADDPPAASTSSTPARNCTSSSLFFRQANSQTCVSLGDDASSSYQHPVLAASSLHRRILPIRAPGSLSLSIFSSFLDVKLTISGSSSCLFGSIVSWTAARCEMTSCFFPRSASNCTRMRLRREGRTLKRLRLRIACLTVEKGTVSGGWSSHSYDQVNVRWCVPRHHSPTGQVAQKTRPSVWKSQAEDIAFSLLLKLVCGTAGTLKNLTLAPQLIWVADGRLTLVRSTNVERNAAEIHREVLRHPICLTSRDCVAVRLTFAHSACLSWRKLPTWAHRRDKQNSNFDGHHWDGLTGSGFDMETIIFCCLCGCACETDPSQRHPKLGVCLATPKTLNKKRVSERCCCTAWRPWSFTMFSSWQERSGLWRPKSQTYNKPPDFWSKETGGDASWAMAKNSTCTSKFCWSLATSHQASQSTTSLYLLVTAKRVFAVSL